MPKNASSFKSDNFFLKKNLIVLLTRNFFRTHTHTHYISSSLIISFIKNHYSVMNPSQSKGTKLKSTAARSLKEKKRSIITRFSNKET